MHVIGSHVCVHVKVLAIYDTLLQGKILIQIFCFEEKYFQLSRKECKEGFDIYKKFVVRMDSCAKIFKVAEVAVIDTAAICVWASILLQPVFV